jgi:acetyl esterase/lipase
MKSFFAALCVMAATTSLLGRAAPAPAEPTGASKTVPFAKGNHGDLLADLYLPKHAGPHPAILFLHGGGWSSGNRTQLHKLAEAYAAAGYVGVAIDYDLTVDGAHFPLPLIESKAAVRWMRANAATYGIDPKRIAVVGSSAGGELAALVALTADNKDYEKGENLDQSSAVEAAGILNGVLDLGDMGGQSKMVTDYLGGECATLKSPCNAASPVNVVHPGAPPFYVGHGTEDQTVPYRQAEKLAANLKTAGVAVTLFSATGAGHTYWNNPKFYQPNADALQAFLARYLVPKP